MSYSNIAEESLKKTLSIYDIRMHVLSQGDRYDLLNRRPRQMKGRAAEKLPEKGRGTTGTRVKRLNL